MNFINVPIGTEAIFTSIEFDGIHIIYGTVKESHDEYLILETVLTDLRCDKDNLFMFEFNIKERSVNA